MKSRADEIKLAVTEPDLIAKSKKDKKSLLYFRKTGKVFMVMAVGSPEKDKIIIRTSFLVLNTSKGDPTIWQRKIST